MGDVRARSRPVVDQERLTIDRQRNASTAAAVTPPSWASGRRPGRRSEPSIHPWPS